MFRLTAATLTVLATFALFGCGGSGGGSGGISLNAGSGGNATPTLVVNGASGSGNAYTLAVQAGNALPASISLQGADSNSGDTLTTIATFNASASSGYAAAPAQIVFNPASGSATAIAPATADLWLTPNGALTQVGTIVYDIVVTDDKGAARNATLTITVSSGPVNNAPSIATPSGPGTVGGTSPGFTAALTTGQSLALSVTATDPDAGNTVTLGATVIGGTLSASQAGFTTALPASVSGPSAQVLALAGTAASAGSITLQFSASDGQGGSATITLAISITGSTGGGTQTATGGSGGASGTVNGTYQGRAYRLFVPSSYNPAQPTALVVALHGYGDTYANYFTILNAYGWTGAATANNFILMVPAHMNATRPSFLHLTGSGGLDQAGTQNELGTLLQCCYYGVGASYNIETTKIHYIGFSEGGVSTVLAAYWFSREIKAVAPYAGGVTGLTFPVQRNIPLYFICGTADSGYGGATQCRNDWQNAGHATQGAWVSGVGHTFSALCTSGPSPSSVYQWMSTATGNPVQSAYQPGGGSSGGSNPSGGSGGAYPGNQSRAVSVSGLGSQTYYLYVPSSYSPGTPMPVLFGFHGAGGAGTSPAAAQQVRTDWASVAEANGFIVIAQASTGSSGGWNLSNDVQVLNAIINDAFGAYNIEQNRVYGWGFSAGGHILHSLGLSNSTFFAAYGVNAGVLAASAGTSAPSQAARKVPVSIFIGTSDSLLGNAQQDKTTFQNAGWVLNTNLYYTEFSGGHTYSASHLTQIWAQISQHQLP